MSEREDWIVQRGDMFLAAPHWVIWDDRDTYAGRHTHDYAVKWCKAYNGSTIWEEEGRVDAVAVYRPKGTFADAHGTLRESLGGEPVNPFIPATPEKGTGDGK